MTLPIRYIRAEVSNGAYDFLSQLGLIVAYHQLGSSAHLGENFCRFAQFANRRGQSQTERRSRAPSRRLVTSALPREGWATKFRDCCPTRCPGGQTQPNTLI